MIIIFIGLFMLLMFTLLIVQANSYSKKMAKVEEHKKVGVILDNVDHLTTYRTPVVSILPRVGSL